MDTSRPRRPIDPFTPAEDELRAFIEGESTQDIVRQVADAFAEELAKIMKRARTERREH